MSILSPVSQNMGSYRFSVYADDVAIFVMSRKTELDALVTIIGLFAKGIHNTRTCHSASRQRSEYLTTRWPAAEPKLVTRTSLQSRCAARGERWDTALWRSSPCRSVASRVASVLLLSVAGKVTTPSKPRRAPKEVSLARSGELEA